MTSIRRFLPIVTAGVALAIGAASANAQDATAKIAVCNPARVFGDMQETKDLKQSLENQRKQIEGEVAQRQQKVKDLQAARDLLKPDSAQYQQADQAFMQEAIQFDTWSKITQAQLQGQQKTQMKNLFEKIEAATKEVADTKKLDLVLVEQKIDLPSDPNTMEQINVDQLRNLINQRSVMFSNGKFDITNDVLAAVDAKYKTHK